MFNSLVSLRVFSRASHRLIFPHLIAPKARASKMLNLVNYRLKVTLYVMKQFSKQRKMDSSDSWITGTMVVR